MTNSKIIRPTILLSVLFILVTSAAADNSGGGAQLVAVKSILNNLFVKGKDITVQYDIYNIGDKAAVNVQLEEDGFPVDYFSVKSGFQHSRWSRISAGNNVTHSLVLTPLQTFMFNVSYATVRYKTADDNQVIVGYTTVGNEITVHELEGYERQFSAHAMEWLTFCMMTTPSIMVPFLLWFASMRKYTRLAARPGKKNN